ncbi:uncharacterized protein LOC141713228 isoform X2 [Apium graveolens]|uniref:uncharacterized protein LOC141713228 isoform X2 n=1 Tax=Apium graveolens TaxID=4045 RepID=UPI003D7A6175
MGGKKELDLVFRNRYYYATLNKSNPPRAYFLDIDTGSDVTWIQCDAPCIKCFPRITEYQEKLPKGPQLKDDDEDEDEKGEEDEHGDALCGACGENYGQDEFWICCDICEKWFHGKCVKITPARAEHIKQYKFTSCSNKRVRP